MYYLFSLAVLTGVPGMLKIEVAPTITPDPNNAYTLQLDATGGLSFSNSTPVFLSPLSHLTLVQTDRAVYNPMQTGQFLFQELFLIIVCFTLIS
jgi:hypothetical protein